MATDPKLIVALEARLDDFERQLKQGGAIAEREVARIEGKLGTLGVAVGTALGRIFVEVARAIGELPAKLDKAARGIVSLSIAAETARVSMERLEQIRLAGIAEGLAPDAVVAGVVKMVEALEEAGRKETDLGRFIAANGESIRDRNGEIINGNAGLELAARLMERAHTVGQKLKVLDIFSLPKDFLPILGQGVEHFQQMRDANAVNTQELQRGVAAAREYQAAVDRVRVAFSNITSPTMTFLLNKAADLVNLTKEWATWLIEKIGPAWEFIARQAAKVGIGGGEGAGPDPITGRTNIGTVRKQGTLVFPTETKQNEFDRQIKSIEKHTAATLADADAVGASAGKHAELRAEAALTEALLNAGIEINDEYARKMTAIAEAAGRAAEQLHKRQEDFRAFNDTLRFAGAELANALDGILSRTKSWADAFKDILSSVRRALIQSLIFGGGPLGGLFPGAAPGAAGGLLGAVFAGARQGGGPVSPGKAFLVGERGPELFVPNTVGMISPGGGVTVAPVYNIDASGADPATVQRLKEALVATNMSIENRVRTVISEDWRRRR